MESPSTSVVTAPTRRSPGEVIKSYFYWTYRRGSFHYDVKVTLILLIIFISPQLWNYGDKPAPVGSLAHPSDGRR